MSMPQPVHVAIVGSTVQSVLIAKKYFRPSAPGMGPPYLAALDGIPDGEVVPPSSFSDGFIDLWLCLDAESYAASRQLHLRDAHSAKCNQYYRLAFPEACILVSAGKSSSALRASLSAWARRISDAWYDSS